MTQLEHTDIAPDNPAFTGDPILSVRDLTIEFFVDDEWFVAAEKMRYDVHPGEVLAIVGESGSGKTQSSMSLVGLLPPNGRTTGSARLGDQELVGLRGARLRRVRGKEIAVIFQEPMTALNPVFTIGDQIVETIRTHFDMTPSEAKTRAIELLTMVEIPEPERRFSSYPHQLSGGQRQRAMIAQALACNPRLLIADEPTTALDVTVQAEILKLMRDLRERIDSGIILITHDMGVVADLADTIIVMKDGKIVERGSSDKIFHAPQHPYTRQLLSSVPHLGTHSSEDDSFAPPPEDLPPGGATSLDSLEARTRDEGGATTTTSVPGEAAGGGATALGALDGRAPGGAPAGARRVRSEDLLRDHRPSAIDRTGEPIMRARDMVLEYPKRGRQPAFVAAEDINLEIYPGEVVGLVGESGSGKTTIGRAMVGLLGVKSGSLVIDGIEMRGAGRKDLQPLRSNVGMVFQDPGSSLNPRLPIGESIGEPLILHTSIRGKELSTRVEDLLDKVELPRMMRNRYPHELSGGQRQRVGIARSLALEPKLLVMDEPTSALDVSVQARVLALLQDLQDEAGFAALFISHDLAVVEMLSSRIAVMHKGRLVEIGQSGQVINDPQHPYTKRLIAAVPVPDPDEQRVRRETRDALLERGAEGDDDYRAREEERALERELEHRDALAGNAEEPGQQGRVV